VTALKSPVEQKIFPGKTPYLPKNIYHSLLADPPEIGLSISKISACHMQKPQIKFVKFGY
jgi:hypothetical protein